MLYPLTFELDPQGRRIWGETQPRHTLYAKALPPGRRIGESWEICDRAGDESVIARGPVAGKNFALADVNTTAELLGARHKMPSRFPLLIKIIDAEDALPRAGPSPRRQGRATGRGTQNRDVVRGPGRTGKAEFFVGLKNGFGRADQLRANSRSKPWPKCFHRIPVKAGDAMFLPSGRVHALGGKTMIFEIQQNSDTTYRASSIGTAGRPGQSPVNCTLNRPLASIDFADIEPSLLPRQTSPAAVRE